ncbi:MAG: hypothetical protein ABSD68_00730 [Candidatus Micrarchaeales archaeon]
MTSTAQALEMKVNLETPIITLLDNLVRYSEAERIAKANGGRLPFAAEFNRARIDPVQSDELQGDKIEGNWWTADRGLKNIEFGEIKENGDIEYVGFGKFHGLSSYQRGWIYGSDEENHEHASIRFNNIVHWRDGKDHDCFRVGSIVTSIRDTELPHAFAKVAYISPIPSTELIAEAKTSLAKMEVVVSPEIINSLKKLVRVVEHNKK